MRLTITALLLAVISACTSNPSAQKKPAVIYADGTELKQFENLMFCGDGKKYMAYISAASGKVTTAWENAGGLESKEKCTVQIAIDANGNIVDHHPTDCENLKRLVEALKLASPVPAPENTCLQNELRGVSIQLHRGAK